MDIRFIPVLDLEDRRQSDPFHSVDDLFTPLLSASGFFAIQDLCDAHLSKILKDTVFKNTSLNGGYVLVDATGQSLLLPRCCSDLNDIHAWDQLAQGNLKQFWIGHPQVLCDYQDHRIRFKPDASQDHDGFEVPLTSLQHAVQALKDEIALIRLRCQQLAQREKLKVDKVLKLIPVLT